MLFRSFEVPFCFMIIMQSIVPLIRCSCNVFLISNSYGLNNGGNLSCSSNCFPLRAFTSTKNVLSFSVSSALPKPVIDLSMYYNFRLQGKDIITSVFVGTPSIDLTIGFCSGLSITKTKTTYSNFLRVLSGVLLHNEVGNLIIFEILAI